MSSADPNLDPRIQADLEEKEEELEELHNKLITMEEENKSLLDQVS